LELLEKKRPRGDMGLAKKGPPLEWVCPERPVKDDGSGFLGEKREGESWIDSLGGKLFRAQNGTSKR